MQAVLHVISDRKRHVHPLFDALLESARGGADIIQIREKKAPSLETFDLCASLIASCTKERLATQLFVNDRVDVALSLPTAGIHLAAKSLPLEQVLKLREQTLWKGHIGCSVHSVEEALQAQERGADYVTFGHIFASSSHIGLPPKGVYALARVVDALSIPVIAIGGIDATNVQSVLASKCSGIAVISAVLASDQPKQTTQHIKKLMLQSTIEVKIPWFKESLPLETNL
ncbi:MAG: thiamine phosphate synthase [Acidibacillus sp.]|nr:thiamine phosphate synthase [Acidibacillus sp.]